jgi:hypothetical protein
MTTKIRVINFTTKLSEDFLARNETTYITNGPKVLRPIVSSILNRGEYFKRVKSHPLESEFRALSQYNLTKENAHVSKHFSIGVSRVLYP